MSQSAFGGKTEKSDQLLVAVDSDADGEQEMATTIYTAAREGDANAAMNMLRYSHGWVAKQAVEVTIDQKISITAALEEAQRRVIDLVATEVEHADATVQR